MWLLLVTASSVGVPMSVSLMMPTDLRCEFRVDPMGIGVEHPRLSWTLTAGKEANQVQTAYRILVASSLARLNQNQGDLWDSGNVKSRAQNNILYRGQVLKSGQQCFWKVRATAGDVWSSPAKWEMGLLKNSDWKGNWISDGKKLPATEADFYLDDPAPLFRHEFTVRALIKRARVFISGLGYHEARLNGERIGDHVLDPGWTDYDNRVPYRTHDVTRQLKTGKNCLGVMLGNGWYYPLPLRLFGRHSLREKLTIGRPRVIAQLMIEYRDGTVETISSDPSWKVGEGPILRNNIYLGEVYDARKEQPGWDRVGFDDSHWNRSAISNDKIGPLVAPPDPPIRITSQWNAVGKTEPKPGVFIYDCGVNFTGWISLKLNLPSGTAIRLRYGELVHKDGSLNPMTSVAGQIKGKDVGGPGAPEIAWQSDTFIAKGGEEVYTPRFTFHGFRYVEITGLPQPLPLESVTAMRLNSDVETVGSFESSNPLLNDIQAMCVRTFKSNILSVQSDCPHRERLGYGGDIVATSEAFMANFDMSGFYAKTVRDWSDAALPDGMFTDTAPFMGIHYCGVIWAMAHPLLIDQLHRYYGDREIGETQYAAAKRWLALVEKQYPSGIVTDGLSDHEGLAPAPSDVMVTPMYFYTTRLLGAQANRMNMKKDEGHFRTLADTIRKAYVAKFINASTGQVGPGTQASQALALYSGIVPESLRPKVFDILVKDIESRGNTLTTGILGTKFMLGILSSEGRADLAYAIVTQPDFPGWEWMLKNGATTLWEHWELSDNTFSHNHPMFGSVSQWMMNWLGGIQPDQDAVGYDKVVIRPQTPDGLEWVKSGYRSIRGKIVSNWRRQGLATKFEITIPPNTTARICLPNASSANVKENGKPLARPSRPDSHYLELTVGSGTYNFSVSR